MLLGPAAILLSEGGTLGAPSGNRDRASSPSGIYECADGHVYIYGGLDPYWQSLRNETGGPHASFSERMARAEEFDANVEAWTRPQQADDVLSTLARLRIPAGKVRHPGEALDVIRTLRPDAGVTIRDNGEAVPAFPALFNGKRIDRQPAPPLGQPTSNGGVSHER